MSERLDWSNDRFGLAFEWSDDESVRLVAAHTVGGPTLSMDASLPIVEILTATAGRLSASDRLVHTSIGGALRYVSHEKASSNGWDQLTIQLATPELSVRLLLEAPQGVAAFRSSVTVTNTGESPVVLRSISSWSSAFGAKDGADFDSWSVVSGFSDWLGESRWGTDQLRGRRFPRLAQELTAQNPRGEYSTVSTGTWSTGKHLPVAAIVSAAQGAAWAWQIEHNGAWRWEIGEDTADGYFALSGPTELDHSWTRVLAVDDSFVSVPVSLALGAGFEDATGELTRYRRLARREHTDNSALSVVFNDYMNTLNGDPTTAKLLPLIESAAQAGSEIFCIDAGWYDNSGAWWDSVGAWEPSTTRFPNGLHEVTDRIQELGMVPGLWLEPEVIGVRSPVADILPDSAFLMRQGQRIVEQGRYHLDLRSPDARAHLDAVVDRLVTEFGVGFFKLDYNINPGTGTDFEADSLGDGLLSHNRAHLAWVDGVLDRHPTLVLENCGSGAMRMDFAMLSRMQMQSTSDQQDFRKYPPIAASAPMSMIPEQAANWAYPQPEMNPEEVAFCLATGILGRFYLSGYLDRMSEDQRALVSEAVAVHKTIRSELPSAVPFWPLGLPAWEDEWISLGLRTQDSRYITAWNRSGKGEVTLLLPDLIGTELAIETVFPLSLDTWPTGWDSATGELTIQAPANAVGARVFTLRPASN